MTLQPLSVNSSLKDPHVEVNQETKSTVNAISLGKHTNRYSWSFFYDAALETDHYTPDLLS